MSTANLTSEEDLRQALRSMEKMLDLISKQIMNKKEKDDRDKLMQNFVKGKGEIKGTSVPSKYAKEIEAEMIKQKIPYMPVPSDNNGYLFLVRQEEESRFVAILNAVSSKDTSVAKELTLTRGIEVLKTSGVKDANILSFNDPMMAEIAKEKLYQTGQTFFTYDNNIVMFPSSLYKDDGKDTEYFKLTYALTQAKADDIFKNPDEKESELIKVRKEQAAYDKSEIEKFIKEARNGNDVILGNIRGNGNTYIEAKNGKIAVMDKVKGTATPIEYLKDDPDDAIYATLSKHTEKIYNMTTFKADFYKENLLNSTVKLEDLPKEYVNFDEEGFKTYKRPVVSPKYRDISKFFNSTMENYLSKVNAEATKRVMALKGFEYMSLPQKAKAKHKEMIALLKDPNFEKDFLTDPAININPDIRKTIHDSMVENFENENQKTQYSVDVSEISVKDLEKAVTKNEVIEEIEEIETEREEEIEETNEVEEEPDETPEGLDDFDPLA